MRHAPVLVLLALLGACAPSSKLRDTQTIHDAPASRVWLVRDRDGEPSIVMCDVDLYKAGRGLCTEWPPTTQEARAPHAAPPPFAQP